MHDHTAVMSHKKSVFPQLVAKWLGDIGKTLNAIINWSPFLYFGQLIIFDLTLYLSVYGKDKFYPRQHVQYMNEYHICTGIEMIMWQCKIIKWWKEKAGNKKQLLAVCKKRLQLLWETKLELLNTAKNAFRAVTATGHSCV